MPQRRRLRVAASARAERVGLLAAIVAARRSELQLRQEELADLAGCSERFIQDLEAGKRGVRLDLLLNVVAALGLHLEVERGTEPGGVTAGGQLARLYGLKAAVPRPDPGHGPQT